MKVLHVVTAFPRWEGDVITPWLFEMLKRLQSKEIESKVLTSSHKGLKNQVVGGIPVIRFRYFFKPWENLTHEETTSDRMKKGLIYKVMPFFYLLFGAISVVRAVRREAFDIVHIHWPFPHALFGYIAKKAGGAKVVTTFYGVELRWVKTKMPLLKAFLRWGIGFSDRVTAISSYTAKEVQELFPEREISIEVIPYTITIAPKPEGESSTGADIVLHHRPHPPAPNGRQGAEERGRGGETTTSPLRPFLNQVQDRLPKASGEGRAMILFAGRLVERKGVEYLLRAFAEVVKEVPADLIVVGEGPEEERLKRLCSELGLEGKAIFKGWVTQKELASLYSQCNAFVLPAIIDSKGDTEGLGVVLLEAMSYKKPVIASNLGGITDIVKHRETGLLVDEKDVLGLASTIKEILTQPQLARELGEAGYHHLQNRFSWGRIIGAWEAVYASVA